MHVYLQDIVILTTDVTRCVLYQAESENVKSRYACILPSGYLTENAGNARRNPVIPITQDECEVHGVSMHGNVSAAHVEYCMCPIISSVL